MSIRTPGPRPRPASRSSSVGSDIFIGDQVVTDARGLVQIKFSDNTKLVVGPNSSLVIEDYLLREDGSGGKLAINALSGTFRFVTGGAAKDRYLIETPTGTIGVRGTELRSQRRRPPYVADAVPRRRGDL